MYLLFVDESGTHGDSHSFVLGAVAVHENDAPRLQRELDSLVIEHLEGMPANLEEYELHVSEMRNARKPKETSTAIASIWTRVTRSRRLSLLEAAYQLIADFRPSNAKLPTSLFGVVVDRTFHPAWSTLQREQFAYEVLLNKFDVMLKSIRVDHELVNRGLVIHDRRVVAETDIQAWTREWRVAAGRVGQLRNLADVPLFADSRSTRLLQVADLVSHSLFRRYNPDVPAEPNFDTIWPRFHTKDGVLHGCVHFTPDFGAGSCDCEACKLRLESDATDRFADPAPVRGTDRVRRRTRSGIAVTRPDAAKQSTDHSLNPDDR